MSLPNLAWSSSEGQADFFSTAMCTRKVLPLTEADLESRNRFAANEVSAVEKKCRAAFTDDAQASVCERAIFAGASYLLLGWQRAHQVSRDLAGERPRLDISSPDVATSTIVDGYPSFQCRFDTIVAGATSNAGDDFSKSRPSCWLKDGTGAHQEWLKIAP